MASYRDIYMTLKENGEFDFLQQLSIEERQKIFDFQKTFNQTINPDNDEEIRFVTFLSFLVISKVYLNYKDTCPVVSIKDDSYAYYVIQPTNGKYQLLDYLINKLIDGIHSIELGNNKNNEYNYGHKILSLNSTRYDSTKFDDYIKNSNLEKSKLYLKSIAHELGHAIHCCHIYENGDGIVVPTCYKNSDNTIEFTENNEKYKREFIKKRKNYEKLSHKYNILRVNENTPIQKSYNISPSNISGWDSKVLEESFTEAEAEDYANLTIKYRPLKDNMFFVSKTVDNAYSLGANFIKSYLELCSKKDQFEISFLGKKPKFEDYEILNNIIDSLMPNSDGELDINKSDVLFYFSALYDELKKHNCNSDIYLFPFVEEENGDYLSVQDYYQDYLENNNYKYL